MRSESLLRKAQISHQQLVSQRDCSDRRKGNPDPKVRTKRIRRANLFVLRAPSGHQFIEHEPGPRGSPQLPHAPDDDAKLFCELPTAKLESCWSRLLLEHAGHAGASDPRTTASKRRSHSLQIYSKIGMVSISRSGDFVILNHQSKESPTAKASSCELL